MKVFLFVIFFSGIKFKMATIWPGLPGRRNVEGVLIFQSAGERPAEPFARLTGHGTEERGR